MLTTLFENQLVLGAAQALAALAAAGLVVLVARWRAVHLWREMWVAMVRGLTQVVVVGLALVTIFNGPLWLGIPLLMLMMTAGGVIAARRVTGVPGMLRVTLVTISLSSGIVIIVMTLVGVIEKDLTSIIPIGSMLIAGSMNTATLALERFKSELESHTGQIEAGLSLGASARSVVEPYVRQAVQASLIPVGNSIRSLGIVWIPGLMAGMILSGVDPVYAAVYQFVLMVMIFCSSGLTALLCTALASRQVFTPADQLRVRQEIH
jgi:putative ABC transport system permease protein